MPLQTWSLPLRNLSSAQEDSPLNLLALLVPLLPLPSTPPLQSSGVHSEQILRNCPCTATYTTPPVSKLSMRVASPFMVPTAFTMNVVGGACRGKPCVLETPCIPHMGLSVHCESVARLVEDGLHYPQGEASRPENLSQNIHRAG